MGRPLLLFIALLTLAACGLDLVNPTPAPIPITPTPTQAPAVIPASPHTNLDQLQSYRANLILDFEGTYQGRPTSGHLENLLEVTQTPPARHIYLSLEGVLPEAGLEPGISQLFQIEETIYLKKAGDDLWIQFSGSDDTFTSLDLPEPAGLILLPQTMTTPSQNETLNGLSVQRYHFSEQDLAPAGFIISRASGALWVATPGDYLVQYIISATLRTAHPNPKTYLFDEASLRLSYVLTDIDADFTITLPTPITAGGNDLRELPQLPDKEIITALPTLLEYTSPISPISATLFYRKELSAQAWTEEEIEVFEQKARLKFSKDNQRLEIIIAPATEADKIKVTLNLEGVK